MNNARSGPRSGTGIGAKLHRTVEPYLYLAPAIVLLGLFAYYPFIRTVADSFTFVNAAGQAGAFAGLANYRGIFEDPNFGRAVANTAVYALLIVPCGLIAALLLALAANRRRKLSRVYETLYALPMAMSVATAALIFKLMLNPTLGVVNYVFQWDIQWFADKSIARYTIAMLEIWIGLGFNFLFLLSAVRNVPADLLECGHMEGAGAWQRVRHIVLPLISPTMFFLLCTNLIGAMLLSSTIIILTGGGPQGATQSVIYYMYHQGFVAFNFGYAYASAIVGFVLAFVVLLASFLYERRGVHYQ